MNNRNVDDSIPESKHSKSKYVDQSELLHVNYWGGASTVEIYLNFCLENVEQFFL